MSGSVQYAAFPLQAYHSHGIAQRYPAWEHAMSPFRAPLNIHLRQASSRLIVAAITGSQRREMVPRRQVR
jgi:hypothetical protein